MKKKNHKKGLHWTTVWLFSVLALTSIVFVTLAAYTEVSSVKRVVSTTSAPAELFSSNCMRPEISGRRLTSTEYTITVCNFDQERPMSFNPSEIKYIFYAQLQVKQGDDYINLSDLSPDVSKDYADKVAKYFVSKTEDDKMGVISSPKKKGFNSEAEYKVTFDEDILEPGKSSIDKYKVEIDEEDLKSSDTEFFVHVWATPTSPSTLKTIESRLYATKTVADTASWTGSFLETDCNTVDYDFYNYIISGNGAGTVDILWDPKKFEINNFFFTTNLSGVKFVGSNIPVEIASGDSKYGDYAGWNKVTIEVNSLTKNRYELQLYKTPSDSQRGESYTGENVATKYIRCFFKK